MRIPVTRRSLLAAPALGALAVPATARPLLAQTTKPALPDWYADLERRTFDFFWELANRKNGLVPDRWPTPAFCSIASVGYALGAYPIGVERGWVTRAAAAELTRTTLRFFWNAPQGSEPTGKTGHKGFFYHFIDMETGHRFRNVELSSVDTTILFMGILFAAEYFDADNAVETEIRKLAVDIYARADWNFFRSDGRAAISMGWHPETGLIPANWTGYNEGMFVYVLALASPTHAVPANSWEAWTAKYAQCWRGTGDTRHLAFAPLFGHQYSHIWIDFRGIRDKPMREAGLDYFENSRRATYANRAYCIANPMGWSGYSKDIWGLTACDGPGNYQIPFKGRTATFYGYAARGPLGQPDERDDGTIAPTAALGSLPFAPEIVVPAAQALRQSPGLYAKYGFLDAINPSFTWTDKKLEVGRINGAHGWLGTDYIGIDQGPILLQAANYRSDFVWKRMRGSKVIRRGLELAGFTGGWLAE
ncbi:Tat pathway signal protein [Sphingomonas sp. BT-65]|uniref:glucoamylase family protein n=1 Tax=Sphingomonas sp. BT-65 TaxID=2989821 RepID=UPI00223622DC|nr:glucoamylase family protein [Sphingomonas sp. BT-65]MCW4462281.1 Tat pathway signal protein [Sphingomonas sp. BT-65]